MRAAYEASWCSTQRSWASVCARIVGSVSKVDMATRMPLIYKIVFPSISTFETPPKKKPQTWAWRT